MICPDKLINIRLAMLHQIVAHSVTNKLVHYVQFARKAKNVNGKQEKTKPESEGFHSTSLTIKKAADE